ncbi:MAG TPA: nuclear transport factor 2 family protein [Acidimicrobiales bacterium]|jgi:hypothetical protein|nr:nuclear transport factor 2 family protein [Acidimicrobiales bacterium]
MDRAAVARWIDGYERSWRSAGTDHLADIFAPTATYRTAPYERPYQGLTAIAALWDAERSGPNEQFTLTTSIVAVEDDTAVVRAEVRYHPPERSDYRDLWIIRFDQNGRCRAFEEWPFSPEYAGWFARGPDE